MVGVCKEELDVVLEEDVAPEFDDVPELEEEPDGEFVEYPLESTEIGCPALQ